MFIIVLTYKKPLDVIDAHLAEHRAFLEKHYQTNALIASGPQTPRKGGIIISHLKDREALEKIIEQDPFKQRELADYQIIEFTPVKYHAEFAPFL